MVLLLAGFSSAFAGADPSLYARPKGLEPAIQFWTKVFSEVTTKQGYIHDNWHLDIIYERYDFDPTLTQRQNSNHIEDIKSRYARILKTLSRGKRSDLTSEEQRVLDLWPNGVGNETLSGAVDRVRFQLGQADKFQAGLKRSGRWRPFILANLEQMGLPREIAALPHVESSFNPFAYSHVGAAGLWQFTRSTGQRYMRVDHIVDERMDPFKASIAAARLLQNNYEVIGTWPLAMTAYNHGAAGMRHAARKMGTTDIDYIIKNYSSSSFKFASRNFYPAFLAVNDIQDDYQKYFGDITLDSPIEEDIIMLPAYLSANDLAVALGMSKEQLQDMNPALRPAVWNNSKLIPKGYEIRVTRGATKYTPEQVLARISSSKMYAQQKPDLYHRVQRGQTLSAIAARYGVSSKDIVALNNLRGNNRLRVGQDLRLPQQGRVVQVAMADVEKRDEQIEQVEQTGKADQAEPTDQVDPAGKADQADPPSSETTSKPSPTRQNGFYKVRRGDSIHQIAKKFNLAHSKLMAMNNLNRRKPIYPGQLLKVPMLPEAPLETAAVIKPTLLAALTSSKLNTTKGIEQTATAVKTSPAASTKPSQPVTTGGPEDTNNEKTTPNSTTPQSPENAAAQPEKQAADTSNQAYVMMISEYLNGNANKRAETSPNITEHLPAVDPSGNATPEEEKMDGLEPNNIPAVAEEIDQPVNLEPPSDAKAALSTRLSKKRDALFPPTEKPDISTDDASHDGISDSASGPVAKSDGSIQERTEAIEESIVISADPLDYTVANNKTIEIQASETLGHYAEWLGIRTHQLRRFNKMRYRAPLVIGQRLKLDFSKVSPEEFVNARVAYHRSLQEAYFEQFEITGSDKRKINRGDSLWNMAKQQYKIPVWLLRQYNPDLVFNKVRAGIVVTFPLVAPRNDNRQQDPTQINDTKSG